MRSRMKTTLTTLATLLLLAAVFVGCDGPANPPTAPHVFEDLLAALEIEGPVGVYESWENIPNPDLAEELREYAERNELGPGHPVSIRFLEWVWSPPPDPLPVFEDPIYESWERALERFDSMVRNGGGVLVEIVTADGGPLIAVEVKRTDAGGWSVGEAVQVGMWMS